MSCAIESMKLIEMKEEKIGEMFSLEREYDNDIHDLKYVLEEEQELQVSLEEKLESIEESCNEKLFLNSLKNVTSLLPSCLLLFVMIMMHVLLTLLLVKHLF
jgi:hypothetical protein